MPCLRAFSQDAESELRFIDGLNELGFPDYAGVVLEKIRQSYPGDALDRAELKIMLAQGKIAEAKAVIAKRADQESETTWKMWLEFAEANYVQRHTDVFVEIYDRFIKKYANGAPEGLRGFVIGSSYRYAQLLIVMGKDQQAAAAMRALLKANPEDHIKRQVGIELAELLVKIAAGLPAAQRAPLLQETDKLCKDIQWGGQDIWFGRSVVLMAHMRMAAGDRAGTRKLIAGYMPILTQIHDDLKRAAQESGQTSLLRLTPIAECRFLMGLMHHEDALDAFAAADKEKDPQQARALREEGLDHLIGKMEEGKRSKDAALYHLYNVFIKYSTSTWAVEAGRRANEIIDQLGDMGVEVKIEKVDMGEMVSIQFREAKGLMAQGTFKEAAAAYLEVLNLFPEYKESLDALADLAETYIELKNEDYAQMVIEYIADRFAMNPKFMEQAGQELEKIARTYLRLGNPDRSNAVYDFFFTRFPAHPIVPRAMFRRAEELFRGSIFDQAQEYYERIATNYPGSPVYLDALFRIGLCYSGRGDATNAIAAYQTFLGKTEGEPPRQTKIDAMYRRADAFRQIGQWANASICFNELVKLLQGPERVTFESATGDHEKNEKLLEGAMFNLANCYARRDQPPAKIPEGKPNTPEYWQKVYQATALKDYEEFVTRFKASTLAPTALAQIAALYATQDKSEEAEKALARLEKDFPDSEAAKNSRYMLARLLLENGQTDRAIQKFKEMIGSEGKYTAAQIQNAGEYLYDASVFDVAAEAFRKAFDLAKEPALRERILFWQGKAFRAVKDPRAGMEALEKMFALNPRSPYTVDAAFALGACYAELGRSETDPSKAGVLFSKAFKSIKKVYPQARSKGEKARADIELAGVQLQSGDKEGGLGSYRRVWLLRSASDPEERPYKEIAFSKSVPLLIEQGRWDDVRSMCADYVVAYSRGNFIQEARKWASMAEVNMATGAKTPAAGASPAPREEDIAPEKSAPPAPDATKSPGNAEKARPSPAPATAGGAEGAAKE